MPEDKKISPKQAAIAVIKKFGELLIKADAEGKSDLFKSEEIDKEKSKKDLKKWGEEPPPPPPTVPGGQTINNQIGNPFGKAEDSKNPDQKQDAELGEKVEHDVEEHMEDNKEAEQKEGHEMAKNDHVKGHIKLAHFIGHMEGKKKAKVMPDSGNSQEHPQSINPNMKDMDKAETGHEKGVHLGVDKRLTGISMAGGNMPAKGDKEIISDAKKEHHKVLSEQKQIKPKLPK